MLYKVAGYQYMLRRQRTDQVWGYRPVAQSHHQNRSCPGGHGLHLACHCPHRPLKSILFPPDQSIQLQRHVPPYRLTQGGRPLLVQHCHHGGGKSLPLPVLRPDAG